MKDCKRELTTFEEDLIWMSYRYCIGRHTIASHMHAGGIAEYAYDKLSEEKMKQISADINNEIYDKLHWNNWLTIEQYYNADRAIFKPLYELYKALERESIINVDMLSEIKLIELSVSPQITGENSVACEIYKHKGNSLMRYNSVLDITDLEVWQRLAGLFDKSSHKWCKLTNGEVVEYYEHIAMTTYGGEVKFHHFKIPVAAGLNFAVIRHIKDENIVEDNITPQ